MTALTFLRDEKDCPIHIGRKEEDLTIHIVLLNLALHRLEVTLNPAHANRERITRLKLFVCLASTGVKSPGTMFPVRAREP